MSGSQVRLYEGDSREVLAGMIERGEMVDSVVCDPPYHHIATVKRFAKTGRTDKTRTKAGPFQRTARGFMNKKWDGADDEGVMIAFDREFWRLVWKVVKPGGYIVAFAAANGYHRMACAIEDAGFITHPMIGWVFSQGFPKAHNAARAIDQALGTKGEIEASGDPVRRIRPGADQNKDGSWEKLDDREYQPGTYIPATEEAKAREGWFYGGQVRKPALEPIYVGQKPFSEKNGALNILKWGTGAVNIDGIRVQTSDNLNGGAYSDNGARGSLDGDERDAVGQGMFAPGKTVDREFVQPLGRWPANTIHDGSPKVVALFPRSPGQKGSVKGTEPSGVTNGIYGEYGDRVPAPMRCDMEGSSARFFECYPFRCEECHDRGWVAEGHYHEAYPIACPSCMSMSLDPIPFEDTPIIHHAKASSKERVYKCKGCGKRTIDKPKCGCDAGTESHPTVKPGAIASDGLMRALVRHVTPPGGIVLDPFAGTGQTGAAARAEALHAILIEREAEYCADIRCRLDLAEPVEECRYCGNTGWFYGDEDLGPCGCELGDKHVALEVDDLIGDLEAIPANSIKSGIYEDLL